MFEWKLQQSSGYETHGWKFCTFLSDALLAPYAVMASIGTGEFTVTVTEWDGGYVKRHIVRHITITD